MGPPRRGESPAPGSGRSHYRHWNAQLRFGGCLPRPGSGGWVQLSTAFGTSTGPPSTHQVSVDIAGLPAGQFSAIVRDHGKCSEQPARSTREPHHRLVACNRAGAGQLRVFRVRGRNEFSNSDAANLQHRNVGPFYQLTANQPWLNIFPAGGNTDSGPSPHNVSVDLTGLSPGTFLALFVLRAPRQPTRRKPRW